MLISSFLLGTQASIKNRLVMNNFKDSMITESSFVTEFGNGFVHGLQNDPTKDISFCTDDMHKLDNVVEGLKDLYQQILSGDVNYLKLVLFINTSMATIKSIDEDCHVLELLSEFKKFTNHWYASYKILEILYKSPILVAAYFKMLYYAIYVQEAFPAGFQLGFMIKKILDYGID